MEFTAQADCLTGKVIIVTGAGNGIGAAVAQHYAQYGADVILLDKNIPALEKCYDAILATAPKTDPAIYPLDLKGASADDYATLANSISDNYGKLDGLVHCAASLGQMAPVTHQDTKSWLEALQVNLTAPYLLTKACLSLLDKTTSSIIFTTDNNKDKAYQSGYGIAKAGIEGLAKQLSQELEAEARVRVNVIDPGQVQTDLFSRAYPGADPSHLKRASDVVPAYVYLMSDDSVNTTGQTISA